MEALRAREHTHSLEALVDRPTYTPNVAARHLRLPVSTVRWWALGNGTHLPVIRIAAPHEQLLSFRNLVEVHVLSAIMCHDRDHVPLAIVRAALALLQERFESAHPLCDGTLLGPGREFFAARFGALTNTSRHGQVALAAMVGAYVERIERDASGGPARLLLFTRGKPEGPSHVMIDPAVRGGEPCITGTSLTTASVAACFAGGDSVFELARLHGRTAEEIEEAIRYESHAGQP